MGSRSGARKAGLAAARSGIRAPGAEQRCELCGKPAPLVRVTECCGRLACYFLRYEIFLSKRSCLERHRRFTLCNYHHVEGHAGEWKTCAECRKAFETEMYVYYGTNQYNFEKLENPPAYAPTQCGACGRVIVLSKDCYSVLPGGTYRCEDCFED